MSDELKVPLQVAQIGATPTPSWVKSLPQKATIYQLLFDFDTR